MAALAGLEFSVRGWAPHVTTFGEPRVGNAALAEFINDRFGLVRDDGHDDTDLWRDVPRRGSGSFRRVTHANDPVPLLPFGEWGYASHAGEIYISKVDLPPNVADLQTCQGNNDPTCIAGADSDSDMQTLESDVGTVPAAVPEDSGVEKGYETRYQAQNQIPMSLTGIPRRLRLWELFFAHRDYFWRLGVCLPQFGEGGRTDEDQSRDEGEPAWWDGIKKKFKPSAEW